MCVSPLVLSFVLAVLMVDVIWLHERVAPLAEALSSYWLVIHVVSAIIATGAFTLGGMTSSCTSSRGSSGAVPRANRAAAGDRDLDRIAYRFHAFGFPVWTFAVLITGPIWAHEAWSTYWNWDPKEVWAFITWVVYAAYLHARSTAGWKGRNAAIVALDRARDAVVQLHRHQLLLVHQPALLRRRSCTSSGRSRLWTSGCGYARSSGCWSGVRGRVSERDRRGGCSGQPDRAHLSGAGRPCAGVWRHRCRYSRALRAPGR